MPGGHDRRPAWPGSHIPHLGYEYTRQCHPQPPPILWNVFRTSGVTHETAIQSHSRGSCAFAGTVSKNSSQTIGKFDSTSLSFASELPKSDRIPRLSFLVAYAEPLRKRKEVLEDLLPVCIGNDKPVDCVSTWCRLSAPASWLKNTLNRSTSYYHKCSSFSMSALSWSAISWYDFCSCLGLACSKRSISSNACSRLLSISIFL
jgi:hypothetical protein